MAKLEDDFSSYATGAGVPSGWTLNFGVSSGISIVEDATVFGGKFLRVVGNARQLLNNALGDVADVELLMRYRSTSFSGERSGYLTARSVSGATSGNQTHTYAGHVTNDSVRIYNYISGSRSLLTFPAIAALPVDIWCWARFKITGNQRQFKTWVDGDPEPAYQGDVSSAGVASAGKAGLHFETALTDFTVDIDFFSAGTGGDPAPSPSTVIAATAGVLGIAPLEPKIDKFINVPTGQIGLTRLNPQAFPKFVPSGSLGIQGLVPRGAGRIRFEMPAAGTGLTPLSPSLLEIFRTAVIPLGSLGLQGHAPLGVQFLESSISDTADATDSTIISLILAMLGQSTANATATLASIGEYPAVITDSNLATDTAQGIGEFPLAYSDTVDAVDAIALVFLLQYADEGDVTDELVLTFLLAFRSLVSAVDELALTGEYPLTVSSTGNLTDALQLVFPLYLESTANGTDALDIHRLLALVSTAQAQDSSLSTLEIVLALSTLAHAQDAIDWARLSELSDTGEATGDVAALVTAASQLADAIDATDGLSWTLALFVNLADTAVGTDSSTVTVEALVSLLSSGHATTFSLTLDEAEDRYTGRVMNTETGALSWYTNVPFDSLAWDTHTKNLFALKPDGLYVFDADDDAGADIDATVTTGVLDFQTDLMKRIDSAFIGYAGGSLLLQVHTTMGGTKQTNTYQMVPLTADVPRETVIKIGKGLKFSYCQFTLKNVDGADFELDRMTVYPVTLSRRRYS